MPGDGQQTFLAEFIHSKQLILEFVDHLTFIFISKSTQHIQHTEAIEVDLLFSKVASASKYC